jgi:hypothetical protein
MVHGLGGLLSLVLEEIEDSHKGTSARVDVLV